MNNNAIYALIGVFTGASIGTLVSSYFKDAEPNWPAFFASATGAVIAFVMYAVERKNRKKEISKADS